MADPPTLWTAAITVHARKRLLRTLIAGITMSPEIDEAPFVHRYRLLLVGERADWQAELCPPEFVNAALCHKTVQVPASWTAKAGPSLTITSFIRAWVISATGTPKATEVAESPSHPEACTVRI